MTFPVDMLNIPPDILNIYPTSSTSPAGDLRKGGLEDVEDVEPKKNLLSTYLLSVVTRGPFSLRPVRATDAPISTRTYLVLNILNIFKTWHGPSRSVPTTTMGRGHR